MCSPSAAEPCCRQPHPAGASCTACVPRISNVDHVVAAFDYAAPGDLLLRRFKSGGQFVLAPVLARLMAQAVRTAHGSLPGATILVPVPSSRVALLRRGFNPAAELARYLGRELGLRWAPSLVRRQREGDQQASLPKSGRQCSASSLYACAYRVDGARIAIVDDVLTTGSTLASVASELRAAGASAVCGLVLARTPSLPQPRKRAWT